MSADENEQNEPIGKQETQQSSDAVTPEPTAGSDTDQKALQEILAQQRLELDEKLGKKPDQSDPNPQSEESPPEPDEQTPQASQDEETPQAVQDEEVTEAPAEKPQDDDTDSAQQSLQQIIALQRAKLKAKLAENQENAASQENPDDSESPSPAAESAEAESAETDTSSSQEGQESDPNVPAQQNLQDIIARQREQMQAKKKTGAPAGGEPGGGEQGKAPTPSQSDKPLSVKTFTISMFGRKVAVLPLVLALNTVLVIVITIAIFRFMPSPSDASMTPGKTAAPTERTQQSNTEANRAFPVTAPLDIQAWKIAEKAYTAERFRQALQGYEKLLWQIQARPADVRMRDFFAVRIARCLVKLNEIKRARKILREPSQSYSPVVRAVACRELAMLSAMEGQFCSARRWAYAAIAVLGTTEGLSAIQTDCDYLIARTLSGEVLSFSGHDVLLPWSDTSTYDPFTGKTAAQLRRVLDAGTRQLAKATMTPLLKSDEKAQAQKRWTANWAGLPVKDLLSRVGTSDGLDVRWKTISPQMRQRIVTVIFPQGVSQQKLSEVACGSAGLLARFTSESIDVYNPRSSQSMNARRKLLTNEAVLIWRRFFLRAPRDKRNARGQFTLARLYESTNQPLEAMRVYRLVANRYGRSNVAARSLYRCAKLKMNLRDYGGARNDLQNLLDKYPDSDMFCKVYTSLGEATRKAGMLDEAVYVFQRLFHLNLSADSRRIACIEIGRCLYERGNYAEASKWVTRYLGLIKAGESRQAWDACFLLGRSAAAAGNLDEATMAFQRLLASKPSSYQRIETLLALIPVQLRRKRFVHAIGSLISLSEMELNPGQFGRYLLMATRAYRSMGLSRRAIAILQNGLSRVKDAPIRSTLLVEQARCQVDLGRLAEARVSLTHAISMAKPGAESFRGQCELAEVSLKMGQLDEAIATANHIVKSSCPLKIRRKAAGILGAAYVRRGQYDRAVDVFSGLDSSGKGGKSK